MSAPKVTLIDYGLGNLLSVRRGLEHCGADVTITSDVDQIIRSERVVLPGVGAFANGMDYLIRLGIDDAIYELNQRSTPLLGICLGMQLLFSESEEFGLTKGLGLIAGRVVSIPSLSVEKNPLKVPFIGWSGLHPSENRVRWDETILRETPIGAEMYFVHSFMASPKSPDNRIADYLYGGNRISAVVSRENVIGCQFHPEKSGAYGLNVLKDFLLL